MWNSSFKDSSSIKRFHYPKQKREEHQNRNTRNTLEHKGITNKSEETRRDNKSEIPNQKRRRQWRWSSIVFFFIVFFRPRSDGGSGNEAPLCSSSSCSSMGSCSSSSDRCVLQVSSSLFLLCTCCVLQVLCLIKSDKNRVCKTRFLFFRTRVL